MPPRDPRLCPALDRAMPADDVPGTARVPEWPERWLVLFGSGEWHPVRVRAWWTDRHGRRVVQVEWHADGSTWEGSYLADPDRMREVAG